MSEPRLPAASILAEEFASLLVDEMQPGAGKANDRRIGIGLVRRRDLRQPMLHLGAKPRASEKDMAIHSLTMRDRDRGHLRMFA